MFLMALTIQNTIKGIVGKEIFEEEKVENVIVKGVEASERTFLNKKNERDVLERISKMNLTTAEVTKLRKRKSKSNNLILVEKLSKRLNESSISGIKVANK